jgi:hypothetical protein
VFYRFVIIPTFGPMRQVFKSPMCLLNLALDFYAKEHIHNNTFFRNLRIGTISWIEV